MFQKMTGRRGALGRAVHSRALSALALLMGFSQLLAAGCGDGDATRLGEQPAGPRQTPERAENGLIRIDGATLRGRLEGDQVRVSVPVHGLVTGTGVVSVSLRSVDDATVFSSTSLDYTVEAGQDSTLEATLSLPESGISQAELVKLNFAARSERGLSVTRSLQHVVPPYEVQIEGPARVSADKQVSYRVVARDAVTRSPLADQAVEVTLQAPDGSLERHALTTDATGSAALSLRAPTAGQYAVVASSSAFGVAASVDGEVEVTPRGSRVLLTTDKPIYKPGQTVHLRALSLATSDRRPNAQADVTFEIEDGKGNKIYKRTLQTDAYGIASSDFAFGSILNEGSFKIRALSADATSEKTVQVSQYALPKFQVGIQTDKAWYLAGERVTAELDLRYFFGKPVANAEVLVELGAIVVDETLFGRVLSRTNADGALTVSLDLPTALPGLGINGGNGLAFLRVTATDSAGQQVAQERAISVAASPISIALVPESAVLVPGLENRLELFVTDPLGAPVAEAAARVTLGDVTREVQTDRFGHATIAFTPSTGDSQVNVNVRAGGQELGQVFDFAQQAGSNHLLVRTDRAVYSVGEDVEVEILVGGAGTVYVDWLNSGQAIDMRTLEARDGVARFSMPVDTALLGENRIQAYRVEPDGNIVRSGRTLFARGAGELHVAMTADRETYAPGEPAQLTFQVTDADGAPAVAALGVQIVDQAVFALVDSKPGLLQTYFELEDEFSRPSYQLAAPPGDLAQLLLDETAASDPAARDAAQTRAAANLAALGSSPVMGLSSGSWAATVQASQALLTPFLESRKAAQLIPALNGAAAVAIAALDRQGCRPQDYYCNNQQLDYRSALAQRIARDFVAYDFWGNAYEEQPTMWSEAARLQSAGPDERAGTGDDFSVVISWSELDLRAALVEVDFDGAELNDNGGAFPGGAPGANAGGFGGAGGSANTPQDPGTPGSDENSAGPRVRQDFPETLYVNPALITDASGRASISVEMADSITQWRVSALGHTASGALGGSVSGVTVFQDFFVDINFPATLTRGDEVDFPIAVYNYLSTPQTVNLELQAADWYTALGQTRLSLALAPGEVRGVSLPVRVEDVGLQTLTLTGIGTSASDAVVRRVRVVPDGKAFPLSLSGSLEPGSVAHGLDFPAGAVPGSEQMYLNVYPAFLSQAVAGMDSVLQVPSGCFEQTTSTTWPNVLVTAYMRATSQVTPEIELRAASLISAGYQRLLTFEHPGGGFSWFGTQDPAPFLSVTAFGLMEFADMKRVHDVDPAMLARTQDWLVAQQGSDGSWQGDQTEFFSFQTGAVRNTAFVLWALAENGYDGPALERGLTYVKAHLDSAAPAERDDPYTLGLVANALVFTGDSDAPALLARIDALKQQEGESSFWPAALQTDFYGGGRDADVTATALITHAFLRANAYPASVDGALSFITANKDANGNFGSTQATTWSLKTLLLAATRGTDGAVGSLSVSVDGNPFSQLELRADQAEVMTTIDMSALAGVGQHDIELSFLGTGKVSYNLVGSHHLPWSAVPVEPSGPLAIDVSYDQNQLQVDDTVRATARIENLTDQTTNMILVTLGVPPGFEVQMGDFAPYLEAQVLSRAELTGKQLILYVSELGARQSQSFEYSLRATLPVRASDGGAEVALYYEPEQKSQAPATTLTATAAR